MTRWFKWSGEIFFKVCLVAMTGWATLSILYSNLPGFMRPWIAAIFAVASLTALFSRYSSRQTLRGICVALSAVLFWWLVLAPSNNRNWQPDVALLPWADIRVTTVTIHNIRNCDYRSETDYTVHYYDRTFDLAALKSIDLSLVYWGSPYIAHTMLSFSFKNNSTVCFSIETRKEIGEAYSNVKGFFKQYELIYVVADERDLIGLRTNYRGEQVYLYRLKASKEVIRQIFLDYLREVNSLKVRPEWYNALTDNCTTSFRINSAPYNPDSRLDWRLIINGFIDEMLYERHAIDTMIPFPELKKRSLINERAKIAGKHPDFSHLIRVELPGEDTNR